MVKYCILLIMLVGAWCLPLGASAASIENEKEVSLLENNRHISSQQLSPATKKALDTVVKKAALSAKPVVLRESSPIYINRPASTFEKKSILVEQDKPYTQHIGKEVITGDLLGDNLSITMQAEDVDEDTLLDQAYNALFFGQQEAAMALYKQVLSRNKNNKSALFGLATIYQRNKNNAEARAIYTRLLSQDPSDQDALNNFLMLVAEESPEEALVELKRLEAINPEFSPLPAQIAMIYARLGKTKKAVRSLNKALVMSPNNHTYRYNLAVLYDGAGATQQAVTLYKELLAASRDGAIIPVSAETIRERIVFLSAGSGA